MLWGEFVTALICLIGGIALQWWATRRGATDMKILGVMLWAAGLILMLDSKLHFFAGPEGRVEP